MRVEVAQVVDRVRTDPAIRALVLTGANGHFCSGGDLRNIAGAGLDVFVDEPRVPLALRQCEQVTLQAHRASATWETRTAMAEMVLASVDQAIAGERPAMSLTT